ncbi:MAG: enoyl-CoA hydratase/isomerase family protein [Deltaproteobacteria bacterium]|nr:MAG: enoyl-CoA hydratase/isomerase family protein [Deltaproteobacteria bacterium]
MPDQIVSLEKDEFIGIITMNRPPVNGMDANLVTELLNIFRKADEDEQIRTIIITSAIKGIFSAGLDISTVSSGEGKAPVEIQGIFSDIYKIEKPVIAAINGHALGGGCELSLVCDFRFMSRGRGTIGLTEVNLGIIPGAGGTQRLPRLIGVNKATELLFNGTRLKADEALEIGLVHRVFDEEKLMEESLQYAKKLAAQAPVAIKLIKRCIRQGLDTDLEGGLKIERESSAKVFSTNDALEGFTAFMEKRKPDFKGK